MWAESRTLGYATELRELQSREGHSKGLCFFPSKNSSDMVVSVMSAGILEDKKLMEMPKVWKRKDLVEIQSEGRLYIKLCIV